MMKFGLETEDIVRIKAVFKRNPGIDNVLLFGSRAMGTSKPGSDIDLAILGNALTFDEIIELHNQLDDLGLLYKFDVQHINSIKDIEVIAHIQRVGIMLYP